MSFMTDEDAGTVPGNWISHAAAKVGRRDPPPFPPPPHAPRNTRGHPRLWAARLSPPPPLKLQGTKGHVRRALLLPRRHAVAPGRTRHASYNSFMTCVQVMRASLAIGEPDHVPAAAERAAPRGRQQAQEVKYDVAGRFVVGAELSLWPGLCMFQNQSFALFGHNGSAHRVGPL